MAPHSSFDLRAQWMAARPDLDTSPMAVVGPLKHIEALLATALEPLYDAAPVTAPELDVLLKLRYAEGPVIARRIAESANCSRAAVSKTLAKLESRGYIERRPSPADRRAALVTATDAGREVVDAMFPRQLAVEADVLKGLGADRERVVSALNLLARVLEQRVRG
ncbi:MarR family winged helix-turn-helix transcriptional regulator [Nocardia sp. BMG51109]|uniref:MarR family winged helix-turn-helix transcriptional regulator n=1 Tax=Nocardia sp. BMG51109 TaxID=1056816 RepID=UPI0004663A4B|nr:MarR family transcriptional regulator [Nocardia sp. BMG51109]